MLDSVESEGDGAGLVRRRWFARRRRCHALGPCESIDDLQDAYHAVLKPVSATACSLWVSGGPAPTGRVQQVARAGLPGRRTSAQLRLCTRSSGPYEWYLLPDQERRELLVEHGQMGREYPDVRANTVASFALGDYEWILAFEADELYRIVDLMRHLRASPGPAACA